MIFLGVESFFVSLFGIIPTCYIFLKIIGVSILVTVCLFVNGVSKVVSAQ